MAVADPDAVYQQAVKKLRLLLSASEAMSSLEASDFSDGAGDNAANAPFLSDPRPTTASRGGAQRYLRRGQSRARRGLFREGSGASSAGLGGRERHNSWHNLTHIDAAGDGGEGGDDRRGEELSMLAKQEGYIKQLEKETTFCREQLAFVLENVKSVLREKEGAAVQRSAEVSEAISNVFNVIHKWENNVPVAKISAKDGNAIQVENARLTEELRKLRETPLASRLQKDNDALNEELKRLRRDLEAVKAREEEAAEQVKRSVQAAEQLKMEKGEREYELSQAKVTVERQQGRIRALIDEAAAKGDEEREAAEKRGQEALRAARDEIAKHIEELASFQTKVDALQRSENDLRRQVEDRDRLMEDVRRETERRLAQVQVEAARAGAARQEVEERCAGLAAEVEHARAETTAEVSRAAAEAKALRARLARADEALLQSRQETLELAEEKAALEREASLLRSSGGDHLRKSDEIFRTAKEVNASPFAAGAGSAARLEDMVRRQSHIIGELRHQCHLVADKLESSVISHEAERRELAQRLTRAKQAEAEAREAGMEAKARLEKKGGLYESLSRRAEEADLAKARAVSEMRQAQLLCEEVKQEKGLLRQEVSFLRDALRSRGLLPEKDVEKKSPVSSKPSAKDVRKQAIVIQRNGQISSPFL